MSSSMHSVGFGDTVAKFTKFVGIQPCGGCEKRRSILNRWFPYQQRSSIQSDLLAPSNFDLFKPNAGIKPYNRMDAANLLPLLSSSGGGSGGRREPDRRDPADLEGERRQRREAGHATSPASATAGPPASFACGIDITDMTRVAIRSAQTAFGSLANDKKHEACSALYSLRTGDYAWDIVELHAQVKSDTLNQPFRPICATSGATPACGSSVQIGGSCHFAGSANYVIFGVMCKLCSDYYTDLLNRASWYEVFDKDTYQTAKTQFSVEGMFGLIDLYKKYVPLLKGDSTAPNINAAKRWSIAGYDGWPNNAATPPADRGNCTMTCPHRATSAFQVSWYPFMHPYARR